MPVGLDPHYAGASQDPNIIAVVLLAVCVVYALWFVYTMEAYHEP